MSSSRVISAPNDEVYLRQGDESVKLSYEQRIQLSYDKGQRFFEDEIVPDASLDDIDEGLVDEYKSRFDSSDRTTEEILKARRLRVADRIHENIDSYTDLSEDEKVIVHYMYNSGQKMTTLRASELTGRSRRFSGKLLQRLVEQEVLERHGTSRNDRNQYYTLVK